MLNRRSPVDQKILETLPHNERGSIRSKQRAELQPWPLKQTVEAQQVMLWRVVAMIQSVPVNQGQPTPYLPATLSAQHRLKRWNRSVTVSRKRKVRSSATKEQLRCLCYFEVRSRTEKYAVPYFFFESEAPAKRPRKEAAGARERSG